MIFELFLKKLEIGVWGQGTGIRGEGRGVREKKLKIKVKSDFLK
jgi:hypothetical protein